MVINDLIHEAFTVGIPFQLKQRQNETELCLVEYHFMVAYV